MTLRGNRHRVVHQRVYFSIRNRNVQAGGRGRAADDVLRGGQDGKLPDSLTDSLDCLTDPLTH